MRLVVIVEGVEEIDDLRARGPGEFGEILGQDRRFYFMPTPTPLASNVIPTSTGQPARITTATLSSSRKLTPTWSSEAGLTYQVQYKASLDDPQWVDLGDPIFARGTTTSFSDDTTPAQAHGFY